ncbi:MAG: hypothetical protein KatS3mg068_1686 [Candidatus Sericytochromatia bacterium]|nr:MAG: hypothetical protein KatS3mg068_1686 [Candidatus Sericytochromatia bacterium]
MRFLKNVNFLILFILLFCFDVKSYDLVSFNTIRNKQIEDEAKEIGLINFNQFLRIYYFNYLKDKKDYEKNNLLVNLNKELSLLKYSKKKSERKPPIILHWTASKTSLGAIKTLFQERKSMKEGIIGVDYLITEPLYNPDNPYMHKKSYIVDLSGGEVATTWFHVPNKDKVKMKHHDRKYNKAINIEIMGWRFFNSNKGKNNDYGEYGKVGIRENFNGNFDNFDNNYKIYSTVIKFLNYLAEKYDFSQIIDEFQRENEIDKNLLEKGILYLNGPLSNFIKGHGLIAIEHTLLFNSDYIRHKKDFMPEELLVLYQDLKDYRKHLKDNDIEQKIENKIASLSTSSSYDITSIKEEINKINDLNKKEYLLYLLYLETIQIKNLEDFNYNRSFGDYLKNKYKEKYILNLIKKYITNKNLQENEINYFQELSNTFKNKHLKNLLIKLINNKIVSQIN